MSNKVRTLPQSGFGGQQKKYKYKKQNKPQQQPVGLRGPKKPVPLAPLVPPSKKYQETINFIAKKGFFVTASYGNKVRLDQVKEFRVDSKDVPVLIVDLEYRNNRREIVRHTKVYRIVRYNENEIIGIESRNMNTYRYNRVDVVIPKVEQPAVVRKSNNSYRKNPRY